MIERAVVVAVGSPAHRSQLTYDRPRTMLPALGKPLTVRMMDRLYRVGIRQYTVILGEYEGAVASYLNAQWYPNVTIDFVVKTAGVSLTSIFANMAHNDSRPFLVSGYNSFTQDNFPERVLKQYQEVEGELILGGAATSLSRSRPHHYALVEGGRVSSISHQPPQGRQPLILTDFAVCGEKFTQYLKTLPRGGTGPFSQRFVDLAQHYVQAGCSPFVVECAWILPVETDHDLLTLHKHLLDERQDAHILSELHDSVQVTPPVRVDPQVSVGQGATLGPYAYLERGSSVGRGAVVSNSIVLENASIPAGEQVSKTIVSSRARIES